VIASLPEDKDIEEARDSVMESVRIAFRPEFINRLDEIILFNRLRKFDMIRIVEIQLRRLIELLAEKNITLIIEQSLKQWIAEEGYDPAYGARPLKRVIQHYIQNRLAEELLNGTIDDGDKVKASYTDKVEFERIS
jgi:ATP-dependent Clp protease ATP-binding subunit ClpB